MTTHASIDIETMSTRANAVVLSVGICFFEDTKIQPFDEIVQNGIELFFDQKIQTDSGRRIDAKTMMWWKEQGEEAQRCLNPTDVIHPREFYRHFESFCMKADMNMGWVQRYCKWYVRGPTFDISIMDDLFADHNVTPPWKYYLVRDIRTWLDDYGLEDNLQLRKPPQMIPHNALHDAAFDAWQMQQFMHIPPDQLDVQEKIRK